MSERQLTPADQRKSVPLLSKYEKARVIGLRKEQLARGSSPLVDVTEGMSLDDIVMLEFKERKIPLKIMRTMPNGSYEEWALSELSYAA